MATKITNKLISLPQDVSIDRVVDHPHSMEIFISCPDTERLCPVCGSPHCVIKDSGRSLTVRHVSVAGKGSFLSFHVPRLLCKHCGSSFSARPYFVHPSMKLSSAAFLAACVGFTGTRSIRDIAIDNGLTEQQVLSVLCSVDFRKPASLPHTLCIDEFKGSSGSYDPDSNRWNISRFHYNISDGSFGCVVDVLPRCRTENYKFTAENNVYLNAIELERYEDTVPMTPYERRLLRRWVISGHSVHEPAISVSPGTIRLAISSMFTAWTGRSGPPPRA